MFLNASGDVGGLLRYPKIMTDEGIRVVRQWLGATNQLEEGEFTVGLLFLLPLERIMQTASLQMVANVIVQGPQRTLRQPPALKTAFPSNRKPFLNVCFPLQI